MSSPVPLRGFGKKLPILSPLDVDSLTPLPAGCVAAKFSPPRPGWTEKYDFSLDGFSALALPLPKSKQEEESIVTAFLEGLAKLFRKEDNWAFLLPTVLSTDYCMRCNTCNGACMVYEASGRQDIYRPNFRSELLRRLYKRYFTPAGKLLGAGPAPTWN